MNPAVAAVDAAVAGGLGSAAALAFGDAAAERVRHLVGRTRRVPDLGPAITAATRFDLASLTKPMATATLALALASDGALELDAPVARWLPGTAAAAGATVAQLLGHGAGTIAHGRYFEAIAGGDLAGASTPRAALIAHAAREPLAAAPGTVACYSDVGYVLLGALLERVGDAPLEELVAARVMAPLGLAAGFVPLPTATPLVDVVATELDDLAPGPDPVDGRTGRRGLVVGEVHDENAHAGGGVAGHAGLFGTLDDVVGFARAMLALARGEAPGGLDPALARRCWTTPAAPGTSWRLGWDTPSSTPGVSHAGDAWPRTDAIGHLGFTGTSLWLDLAGGRYCVLLTNRIHPRRDGTADAIRALRRAVGDAAMAP
ncbi:MAG: serine hydrolase domain-containing protein [Kofleriaceae bacterium]